MFNFFKKKKPEIKTPEEQFPLDEEDDNITVSIKFFMNDSTPMVDVELRDYEEKTTDDLCKLVAALGTDQLYIETIEMIKTGLLEDAQGDTLLKLALHIGETLSKKHKTIEKTTERPCLKPSDML